MAASVTIWERFEPRPRSNDLGASFEAPVRDPLWFLTRQWQVAEFQGQDAGSMAYVEYFGSAAKLPRFVVKGAAHDVDETRPLERQTLAEPIEPDFSLRVELGQLFETLLAQHIADAGVRVRLLAALAAPGAFALQTLSNDDELNPLDPASVRFLALCVGRALDGYALYVLAQQVSGGASVPNSITSDAGEKTLVAAALADLLLETDLTFGSLGTSDPEAWTSRRLEYDLEVVAINPNGSGHAALAATPNPDGEFDWSSFDVIGKDSTAPEVTPVALQFTTIPSAVRFMGMPNPRHWYFEQNEVSFADVHVGPADTLKALVTTVMLTHGSDWFVLPFDQELGTAVKTNAIVVTDVFGKRFLVERADKADKAPQLASKSRWTLFSTSDSTVAGESLADYFVLPLSPGPLAQDGLVLEDVRFARDETANMAWAIERITESAIGEQRSGRERDAEIAARQNLPAPPPGDPSAPLRYQIESQVPANWIPLLGVQPNSADPSIELEKAAMLHPKSDGTVGVVASLGRFLTPTDTPVSTPIRFVEEEVPRDGLRLLRTISRSRWIDGSTHLWVSRRRRASAGEAQSGLRFDSALPNQD